MEFGLYLNQYHDARSSFTFDHLFEQLDVMEATGFDLAAAGQRHFYDDGFFDPWSTLTAMASHAETLTIMANILILPVYHPIHVAERIVSIDHLTSGHSRFGVSLGYRESELENFGVPMPARVDRFTESLTIIKRLLGGDRFDHDGDHFVFDDAFVRPGPIQQPRPPLEGGGSAPAAIRRAASRCDGFTAAITDPEVLADDIELYRETLKAAGASSDDGHVTIMVDGYVADSREAAKDALDPYALDLHEQYIKWGNPEFTGRPTFEDVEAGMVLGSPQAVAGQIETYQDLGVDTFILRTQFPGMSQVTALAGVRRFGEDVIPLIS